MKYFSIALITVAAFAGDFLAYWAELDKEQQKGWSYTSTACLLFAAWFFWRGRPGGPAEDEERRGNERDAGENKERKDWLDRQIENVMRRRTQSDRSQN